MSDSNVRDIMARTIGHKLYRFYDPRDIGVPTSGSGTAYMVANAVIAAINAAGLVIVPRQPTDAMIDAALVDAGETDDEREPPAHQWRAMLEAVAGPLVDIPLYGPGRID